VIDLMQTGEPLFDAKMVPDLPLATHMALLVGPALAPSLEKQLDTYRSEPEAITNLDTTLLALGRVGTPALLPKLEPLLTSSSPEVRALAADTISRLGDPRVCEKLMGSLASSDLNERRLVARSFERWKPEPCYRGMVGRLEIEEDVGVRGALYSAIASMGGEASLEVFRSYLRTPIPFDQPQVITAIGEIGSPKGLNMLRSLLDDENHATVIRALEAIGAIGGESATDTLMAYTSDSRKSIAWAARNTLADTGVKKVAPRVASALLELVRQPVGNLSLRAPIARGGDALVALGYTEPLEEIKTAAALQPDPEIKASLESCARRLELLAKNGDDVAAWEVASTSSFPDARRLAYRRLAQIGSPAAVKALAKRLAKTDLVVEDRAAALVAIGDARAEGAAELVERHLSEPGFDAWELREARAAAAYAARRLGGDRMAKALRQSAIRREGRDWATLVYLAVLEKGAALPTLKDLRVRRLRYPESVFGEQEIKIDGIIADLSTSRSLKRFDVLPDVLPGK
jgi:HEAT repeat protein